MERLWFLRQETSEVSLWTAPAWQGCRERAAGGAWGFPWVKGKHWEPREMKVLEYSRGESCAETDFRRSAEVYCLQTHVHGSYLRWGKEPLKKVRGIWQGVFLFSPARVENLLIYKASKFSFGENAHKNILAYLG